MDRDRSDRLPTDPLPTSWLPVDRIPGIGGDTDETTPDDRSVAADSAAGEETADTDAAADEGAADADIDPIELDLDEPADTPSRRETARKLLLLVSLAGTALAVLAALLRRVLGTSEEGDEDDVEDAAGDAGLSSERPDETEPAPEDDVDVATELLTADAEGVAALIGLGFQLLVRALVGDDESESSTV